MKVFLLCIVCLSLALCVTAQYVQIQALPQIVDMGEDTLTIVCSLSNPSQVKSLFIIELQRNTSTSFEKLITLTLNTDTADYKEEMDYGDLTLRSRTTATGSLKPPSTAELRLTFAKENVICPGDFKEYRCKISGLDSSSNTIPGEQAESTPVKISYRVHPKVIEMPRVRILGQQFDTNERQFEVGTALQLTCTGQIGSDPSATIRWCAKTAAAQSFTGLPQTPIHSQASPSGCQYTRSSTITYNLTTSDTSTQFQCESGYSGLCGTGTAQQNMTITLVGNPGVSNPRTSEDTSDAGIIAGAVIGGLAFLILVILLVYFLVLRRKTDGETYRTKEDVPGYNGPANPEGPVYSVPVKDHPPERQPRKKHPRDHEDDSRRRPRRGHENEGLDDEHTDKRSVDEDNKYENHGYTDRVMNDYNDGDVMPRQGFGSAV